jgi:hypothetical protein
MSSRSSGSMLCTAASQPVGNAEAPGKTPDPEALTAGSDWSGHAAAGQPLGSFEPNIEHTVAAVTAAVVAATTTADLGGRTADQWTALRAQLIDAAGAIDRLLCATDCPASLPSDAAVDSSSAADSRTAATDLPVAAAQTLQDTTDAAKASDSEQPKRDELYAQRIAVLGGALLSDEIVLRCMLSFVGPSHSINITSVSKTWKLDYDMACTQLRLQNAMLPVYRTGMQLISDHASTRYSVIFSSSALLTLANDSGTLAFSTAEVQFNAGRHGSVAVLLLAHDKFGMPFTEAVVRGAARSGCAARFDWLREQYTGALAGDTIELAARSGSVHILQQLQTEGLVLTEETAVQAVESGQLDVVQFLHAEGCQLSDFKVWLTAVTQGAASIFIWLHTVGCIHLSTFMAEPAVRGGSIELMQYLQQHGITPDESCMRVAIEQHDLAMCKHLYATGCEWKSEFTSYALRLYTHHIVQWALTVGAELTPVQQTLHAQRTRQHLRYAHL